MQSLGITRKDSLKRKPLAKKLSYLQLHTGSSSPNELSLEVQTSAEVLSPTNLIRPNEHRTLNSYATPKSCVASPKCQPISPSTPFGPKTRALIIPCKDLSDSSTAIEMDVLENYNVWSDIGRGSYATVKLATHKTTMQKCAIKIYSKKSLEDPALKKNVSREIKILKKIEHQNIVRFYEEILGKNNLYIVMEYVRGIALNNYLMTKGMKRLDEPEACGVFAQLVSALDYCHTRGITHRDIKLENVQLDLQFNVKLIDFGFATCFANSKKSLVYCGSPSYMAPEIINKQEFFGPPVDIWAAGVLLFILVTGSFPFKSNNERRVFEKIKKAQFEVPEGISDFCVDLIKRMIVLDPQGRLSASEVLKHPWVASCGGSTVYAKQNGGDNIEVTDDEEH